MSGAGCAVVDLRRPVKGAAVTQALSARRWDTLFAVTPLAAWTLEEAGLPFETNAALVDREAFRASCLENHERVRRALTAAFGAEHESWMGLMLELTAGAAYALSEDMRWRSLEPLAPEVFSDVPYAAGAEGSLVDHLYNRGALYFGALPASSHHHVPPSSERVPRLLNRIRRLTPASLARKALRLAPRRPGPALVTDFDYDWAVLRPHLSRRFSSWTFKQACAEALALGGPEPDAAPLDALGRELEREFRPVLSRTLSAFVSLSRGRAQRYALLRRRLADHLPALAARHDWRAAVGTICGTDEQFLAHYYMKASGRPSLMYQHGAYMQRWPMTGPLEVLPATHNFAYGSADESFISSFSPRAKVRRVGSALLEQLTTDRPFKSRFLYVTYLNPGNLTLVESRLAHPETDHAALFARHKRVLQLFSRFPGLSLTIRHHPSQYTWALYEPLREFVAQKAIPGIRFDQSPLSPDRYFAGYEGVIMDYPSTGLLQALAKGKTIACHVGVPYETESAELLGRAVSCAGDDEAFLALLERWFARGADDGDPAARRDYLLRYGRVEASSLAGAAEIVDDILA